MRAAAEARGKLYVWVARGVRVGGNLGGCVAMVGKKERDRLGDSIRVE